MTGSSHQAEPGNDSAARLRGLPTQSPGAEMTIGDAAERVGVAATTLRTWERRYGVCATGRTQGGHRRYSVQDVATLQEVRRLADAGMAVASAAAQALSNPGSSAAATRPSTERPHSHNSARRFSAAVRDLEFTSAATAAADILAHYGTVRAWTDVFTPHLQAAGRRWARSQREVEREHVASAAIHAALTEYARARTDGRRACAMLAAATPTEQHTLPLDALVAAIAERGLHGCSLGTLPSQALRDAARTLRPSVLVLWSHSDRTAAPRLLTSLAGHAPSICSAGPGWSNRRSSNTITHLADLGTAVDTVSAWAT